MERIPWARDLARRLLAKPLPTRWAHTQGVGRKAESIAHIVGDDADLLICAAWLHDIGYAPELFRTGFHPLDGARYLRDVQEANDRLCRLVAYHSNAIIEGRNRGLADELADGFAKIDGLVTDALTYCDMTTSSEGYPVDVETRLHEVLGRYGASDVVTESIKEARTKIVSSVRKISDLVLP